MQPESVQLPPNPYTRQPIKKKDHLAGRPRELKEIRYYLNLTTVGQSYHLALIGARGSGKTSLLNAAEATARELKLVPVRIDLNEEKAKTPGQFWHDVYATLLLALEQAGCWNGHQAVYSALFQMIHGRNRPADVDLVVLRMPFVIASHQGPLKELLCPDALIVHDFNTIIEELKHRGSTGLVLLIDEADCLGQNLPLIQMFRNIFQRVDGCSLVLAGTDAVFPTLTEVFSPIPRQFHRISVKSFAHWGQTRELIVQPFSETRYEAVKQVLPRRETVQELHELCGGAPDELQLYCHHMYRQIESQASGADPKRMDLVPQVFREVLNEYRASSLSGTEEVLDRIERLPETLLFKSHWLSRRALRVAENVTCAIFEKELQLAALLGEAELQTTSSQIEQGYVELHQAGITRDPHQLDLMGAPLTYGFWKSFVEVEKKKRWTWSDDSFEETMVEVCIRSLLQSHDAIFCRALLENEQAVDSLTLLRHGQHVETVDSSWFADLQFVTSKCREKQIKSVVELVLVVEFAGKQRKLKRLCPGDSELEAFQQKIHDWLAARQIILDRHKIGLTCDTARLLLLPTDREIHRLGWIGRLRTFEEFGRPDQVLAIEAYKAGNLAEAINIFKRMLDDKNDRNICNNLAYCLVLEGLFDEAVEVFVQGEKMAENDKKCDEPIWHHNRGVLACLTGDLETGVKCLRDALLWIERNQSAFDPQEVVCMMLLNPDCRGVSTRDGLPVDAAILLNLCVIGNISVEEVRCRLAPLYPQDHEKWLVWITQAGPAPTKSLN